jgi:hypothetical protein
MTAFEDLERQLRQAVVRRNRWRSRLRRAPVLGLSGAVLLAGGALGARELLTVGEPIRDLGDPKPSRDRGPGVTQPSTVGLLALRVKDPTGAPSWAVRVFKTNRGAGCVQVGQVYRGRFGLVRAEDGPGGKRVFRPVRARGGATSSLCSGAAANGFPVVKGLRKVEITGGMGDPRRCGSASCPITEVRVIRYGLLGPAARRATLVDLDGRRLASMRLSPKSGGAYLFVHRADPEPYRKADDFQRALSEAFDSAHNDARNRGLRGVEAIRAAQRAMTSRARELRRQSGLPRRYGGPQEAVEATFSGGRTMRVAGPGRTRERLPGIARRRGPTGPVLRASVSVRKRRPTQRAAVVVSFKAPVAISRFDAHYQQTLDGPSGRACTGRLPGGFNATGRNVDVGERVEFVVPPPRSSGKRWCPGRYGGRVVYKDGSTGRAGRLVGSFRFRMP